MESVDTELSLSNAANTVAASNGITTKTSGSELNLSAHELDSPVSLDLQLPNQADGSKQSNDQPRVYPCKFCTGKFATYQELGGHQRAHRRAYLDYYRFHPYSNRLYYGYSNPSLQEPSRLVLPSTALLYSSIHRPRIGSFETLSHINRFGKRTCNSVVNFGGFSSPNLAGKEDSSKGNSLIQKPWTASTSNARANSSIQRPRNESFNAVSHINGFGANTINSFLNIDDSSSTTGGQAGCENTRDEVDPLGIDLSLKL